MMKLWKAPALALLALLTVAPAASAQGVARGGVVVRRFYFVPYGPAFYPGWYDPWWWGPGYYYPPVANTGEIKLVTQNKEAKVYVDGGYAGLAGKLKKFSLRPGNHTIELRDSDNRTFYSERVQVIAGKTVKVRADYS